MKLDSYVEERLLIEGISIGEFLEKLVNFNVMHFIMNTSTCLIV